MYKKSLHTTAVCTNDRAFLGHYIASPLNYIGGKYKLLPQIFHLFPQNINTFVDLFCGGCSVGINVKAQRIIFNDNLKYLIDLYHIFQDKSTEEIVGFIDKRIEDFQLSFTNAEGYIKVREEYNKHRNPLDLFVLVAYSFNHQIRFNNSHEFNNPFGRERSSFNPNMRIKLIDFVRRIKLINCSFTCNNFDDFSFSVLDNNDFVYCDPPYLISSGTYNDGKRGFTGWGENEEKRLLRILDDLDGQNIKFALSNVIAHKGKINHLLEKWIADRNYNLYHLIKNYSNSSYHTKNRDINSTDEVLITNYLSKKQPTLFD